MAVELLVLAAGMGSRYGGIKQIEPIGPSGESILAYSVYDALQAGFDKITFIIRREIQSDFESYLEKQFNGKVPCKLVFQSLDSFTDGNPIPPERNKPWGTGHAVLCATDTIKSNFAVINADDFYGRDAYVKLADYLAKTPTDSSDYCMVAYTLKNTLSRHGTVSRGICSIRETGELDKVVEHTKIGEKNGTILSSGEGMQELTGEEPVSMNLFGFTPTVFTQLKSQFTDFLEQGDMQKGEFYIPGAVNTLISREEARVPVLFSNSTWFGVTYREDKEFVKQSILHLVEQGVYPPSLSF